MTTRGGKPVQELNDSYRFQQLDEASTTLQHSNNINNNVANSNGNNMPAIMRREELLKEPFGRVRQGSSLFDKKDDGTRPNGRSIIMSATEQNSITRTSIVPYKFSANDSNLAEIERGSRIRGGNDPDPSVRSKKWHILFSSVLCFSATFHCLFSISALEIDIRSYYDDMSSATFGSFGTASFTAAMVAAIIIPHFVNKYDLYKIIIFGQCSVTVGQILTVLSYELKVSIDYETDLFILYIGRACIGFGLGIDSVCIQACTGLWFRGSPKQTLAFALVGNAIEVGISTALFILLPIAESVGGEHLCFWPLMVGVVWAFISIIAAFYMLWIEYELSLKRSVNDKNAMKTDTNFLEAIRIINKHENCFIIWGVIIILFNCKCIADILFYESEAAYYNIFGISKSLSDSIVSLPSVLGLSIGAMLGWIIGKFEQLSMTLVFATLFISLGLLGICANSEIPWLNIFGDVSQPGTTRDVLPWAATGLYALGLEMFFITGFSSLFRIIPVPVMSVASSLVAILTYGSSMVGTYIYGYIADQGDSGFSYAFFFLACIGIFGGFIWAVMSHIVDGKGARALRKDHHSINSGKNEQNIGINDSKNSNNRIKNKNKNKNKTKTKNKSGGQALLDN